MAGAQDVAKRAPSQSLRLLQAYSVAQAGYTSEEAAKRTGLIDKPGCCYWKRCSELREQGYIREHKIAGRTLTRRADSGSQQIVCVITDEGRELLRSKGL